MSDDHMSDLAEEYLSKFPDEDEDNYLDEQAELRASGDAWGCE